VGAGDAHHAQLARGVAVEGGTQLGQRGTAVFDACEGDAGETLARLRRHRLARDGDGSVFNSLVNEQVAVGLLAAEGDEEAVRPDLPAVVRQMVDRDFVKGPLRLRQEARLREAVEQGLKGY